MSDLAWVLAVGSLFLLLGAVFAGLGIRIWKKRRVDLIIRHHCDKVKEADLPAYCRLSGIGVLVIGVGMFLSGVLCPFFPSASVFLPMTAGLLLGIGMLAFAGIRYNR